MIGLSLSICVQQIIRGQVDINSVDKIITATKAPDETAWNRVIGDYRESYWQDNPDEGERIARKLIAEGKIEQPRLTSGRMPNVPNRCFWVDDESEIKWC